MPWALDVARPNAKWCRNCGEEGLRAKEKTCRFCGSTRLVGYRIEDGEVEAETSIEKLMEHPMNKEAVA